VAQRKNGVAGGYINNGGEKGWAGQHAKTKAWGTQKGPPETKTKGTAKSRGLVRGVLRQSRDPLRPGLSRPADFHPPDPSPSPTRRSGNWCLDDFVDSQEGHASSRPRVRRKIYCFFRH